MSLWEFYESKNIMKTRKEHRCYSCGLIIPIKTACFYESGKFDGDMVSQHSHNECAEMLTSMNRGHDGHEGEWLELNEMKDVYPHNSFDWWKEQIREKYELGGA